MKGLISLKGIEVLERNKNQEDEFFNRLIVDNQLTNADAKRKLNSLQRKYRQFNADHIQGVFINHLYDVCSAYVANKKVSWNNLYQTLFDDAHSSHRSACNYVFMNAGHRTESELAQFNDRERVKGKWVSKGTVNLDDVVNKPSVPVSVPVNNTKMDDNLSERMLEALRIAKDNLRIDTYKFILSVLTNGEEKVKEIYGLNDRTFNQRMKRTIGLIDKNYSKWQTLIKSKEEIMLNRQLNLLNRLFALEDNNEKFIEFIWHHRNETPFIEAMADNIYADDAEFAFKCFEERSLQRCHYLVIDALIKRKSEIERMIEKKKDRQINNTKKKLA